MKKLIAIAALVLGAVPVAALPIGGGGGGNTGGGCKTCSCTVTGSIGNKTCSCPSTTWGGSGCLITYTPGWGNDCDVLLGPCAPAVGGFAP